MWEGSFFILFALLFWSVSCQEDASSAFNMVAKKTPRYAIGTTILRDDGAASYSKAAAIMFTSAKRAGITTELFAIVNSGSVGPKAIQVLKDAGVEVITATLPFVTSEIKNQEYRELLESNHFLYCGVGWMEFFKLRAWQLTQYDKILLLDADMYINRDLSHIFELPGLTTTDGGEMYSALSGGFLLFKPDNKTYHELVDIVLNGKFDKTTGWHNFGLDNGRCCPKYEGMNRGKGFVQFGSATAQGLLYYYYKSRKQFYQLPDCIYNLQFMDNCENINCEDVFLYHYTYCGKPWKAPRHPMLNYESCTCARKKWIDLAHELGHFSEVTYETHLVCRDPKTQECLPY
eukprot:TRINITY_DN4197_c0_g1::TRINITY_DN4197_c0_g1_i1::g.2203::m.2203 TRINITY_DN4197_c0_g1::TRINITY_DN4197_c0_g1_i1::g.2203  ORF type:complete len:362 (+),score=36.24,sp/H2KYQ5/GYG1_CAEEL/25.32/4e-08,Glyco_transf_8/PF01501.15/5.6e-09,Glyco_transf_8/PF01501.15/0.52,Mannosyl_trans3/PF11051.3/0.025,DUF3087/PF11286.3/0.088,Nitro_FeMo-Co/PF02579.12/0.17 TRINITY_DN4197_c0_g1_i1:50-1087(+)